ncbi:uncharacterized protein A1O9_02508 [Exophiala aquamarina CBS 119918]|uniref:RRM domain-containing protein n=1 Tax=Exophiala aquamarina CBS 119918 TaxID=1182545 RepID=A0A072PLH8_9EURO|nr:uncharacterized protein A1O9_02508 [Exophiala aquamarina CBS 119918]KEF60944.1 hypothetical protein A1O9_02508 [Exophiala aquamarina CBS 119918]
MTEQTSITTRRGYERPRERRDRKDDRREDDYEHDRDPPPAKIRVENLNYELTEDDIYDLFTRIGPVLDAKLRYDRAGRSDGIAFVTYQHLADARAAIRDYDGANAKGQPIRLTLLPPPRRDNPFDKVENPKSLFDRIEAPGGRDRRRSHSPTDEVEDDHGARRGLRRAPGPRDRRSDVTKPAPDGIDRYIPGQRGGRSSSHRGGGRRPGERRDRVRDGEGPRLANGRPRKTAEELDAEMDDYWGTSGAAQTENGNSTGVAPTTTAPARGDDIDMIE